MGAVRKGNRLRVFEAFAGIGAQHSALSRLNINFEIVGVSEWFIDAIECYDAIHYSEGAEDIVVPSIDEVDKYLSKFSFSRDSVNPCDVSKLNKEDRIKLYKANNRINNFGSITEINGDILPEIDLLVYSFPCQDLSTGGKCKGMKKGSGTRSGLLWEIERILIDLKNLNKLPEYLLLENVKTLLSESNKDDLNEWLSFLESIGYYNDKPMILNSYLYGVPQDRERVFISSHLGSNLNVNLVIENYKHKGEYNISDFIKNDYKNYIFKEEADEAQLNRTPSREVMWKINGREIINNETKIRTITCNMDRQNTAALFRYNGPKGYTYRRLTIREAFLLMGFTEEEYLKAKKLNFSYRKMNKLIGNSIVVNVLESIFSVMFGEKYRKG